VAQPVLVDDSGRDSWCCDFGLLAAAKKRCIDCLADSY